MPTADRNRRPDRDRRRAAKETVGFATGEVHDRLIDAAQNPDIVALEQLSAEEREAARVGDSRAEKQQRAAASARRRSRVKARKIP